MSQTTPFIVTCPFCPGGGGETCRCCLDTNRDTVPWTDLGLNEDTAVWIRFHMKSNSYSSDSGRSSYLQTYTKGKGEIKWTAEDAPLPDVSGWCYLERKPQPEGME